MTHSALKVVSETSRIDSVFDKQQRASRSDPYPDHGERIARLEKLEKILAAN